MSWDSYRSMFEDIITDDTVQSVDDESRHHKQYPSTSELANMFSTSNGNLNWIVNFRLPCFRRSLLYRQYKLYKVIQLESTEGMSSTDENDRRVSTKTRSVSFYMKDDVAENCTSKSVSLPPLPARPGVLVRSHTYPTFDSDSELDEVFLASGRCSVLEFSNDSKDVDTTAHMNMNELKRKYLNSATQMADFLEFLDSNTSSHHLLTLWMKIERYKEQHYNGTMMHCDTMATAGESLKDTKMMIFRFIQERFRLQLTDEAMLLIMNGISEDEVALNLLRHGQSDILKRICEYWLPRYLLHTHYSSGASGEQTQDSARSKSDMRLFPSLSLAKSLPIHGEQVQADLKRMEYTEILRSANCSRWMSGTGRRTNAFPLPSCSVTSALLMERDAGCPFTQWLSRSVNFQACDWLNFWLDVNDYIKYFHHTDDRFLKLSSLWQIFHRHLYDGNEITCNDVTDRIYTGLKSLKAITKEAVVRLFQPLLEDVVRRLEAFWKVYYEQDESVMERFEILFLALTSPNEFYSLTSRHLLTSSLSSADNTNTRSEHDILGNRSAINTKNIHSTTSSKTSRSKHRLSTERLSHTDRGDSERRQRSSKRKQDTRLSGEYDNGDHGDDGDDNNDDEDDDEDEEDEDDFTYCLDNPNVLSQFKYFMENEEGRDALNSLHMYTEIDSYFSIKFDKRSQKQQTAMAIYKTFFDKSSRKSCHLPDTLVENLRNERPTSPLLREAQQFVLPQLCQCYKTFKQYCFTGNATHGRRGKRNNLAGINGELNPKSKGGTKSKGLLKDMMSNEHGKQRRGSLRASVSKEDRRKFMTLLSSDFKKNGQRVKAFRNYLLNCDSGGFARLEKDFLFCIEVAKFKELFAYLDEDSLHKKAEVIVDVFLDSASPPWIQVDLSPEIASKTSQRFQQMFVVKSKPPLRSKDPSLFDEAMAMILKELLPFWSGFLLSRKTAVTPKESPQLTREEKKQLRLYSEFKKFNPTNGPVYVKPGSPSKGGVRKSQLIFSLYKGSTWKKTFLPDVPSVVR